MSNQTSNELLRSRVLLTLADSVSSIGVPSDEFYVEMVNAGFGNYYLQFLSNYLVVTYSNFPDVALDLNNKLPVVVVYDTSTGKLIETSRLNIPIGVSLDGVISPTPKRPFVAVDSVGTNNKASTTIYELTSTGQLVQKSIFNSSSLPGIIVNFDTTVQQSSSFSSDGKYLMYGFTTKVDNNLNPIEISNVIFKVSKKGILTPRIIFTIPNIQNSVFNIHSASFVKNESNKCNYSIILFLNAITNLDPASPDLFAEIISYTFDVKKNTVAQTGLVSVNQSIIGSSYNPIIEKVIICTREADYDNLSILQNPINPIDPTVPRPFDELRMYSYNPNAISNAIQFLKGHNLDARGLAITWSNDGKKLILVARAGFSLPANTIDPGTGTLAEASPAVVISALSYNCKNDTLHFEDVKVGPPSVFGPGWSDDDKFMAVAGFSTSLQKDTQLYSVSCNQK